MGAGLIVAWKWVLRRIDLPKGEPLPMPERLKATAKAFWALLMPIIIIGGMKTGVFTPTEAAVVAAFYALVVALWVHREMKLREIRGVLVRAAKTTAIVMFLCAGAQVASYMITLADLPSVLTGWLGPLVDNPRLLMAVMMVALVLIGTALDLTPTILIFAPVMLPIAVKAGIDPVYFGLMFVLNGAIGLITPPVGTVLNVVAGRGPPAAVWRDQGGQPLPARLHADPGPVRPVPADRDRARGVDALMTFFVPLPPALEKP
jgi:tripartite ATP-independent transporter DctM subunit